MQIVNRSLACFRVSEGGASVAIDRNGPRWHLFCLETQTQSRGKGHARRLLMQVVRAARRLNKTISLTAAPYGDKPTTLEQLLKFYTSCGFKIVKQGSDWARMEYNPK